MSSSKQDELLKKIDAKIRMLRFTRDDTERILSENKLKALERHEKVFADLIEEIHCLKVEVQKTRIENEDKMEVVREWSLELEEQLAVFEETMDNVKVAAKNLREGELEKAKTKEQESEQEKRKRIYEEELKLEEAKLEMKQGFEKKMEEIRSKSSAKGNTSTKLPKLVITKFQGTFLDWQRFWGQFETEIDKAEISQIAKLSYLKELLAPKVRPCIDGLPFTVEGYERAKSILKTRYGKPSEVANAHMQSIISLPTIHGESPRKIHEFLEKLVTDTQALETMGKIKEVNGYVRTTLDKLLGIRADLVRMDDDWQSWGFPQMVEALRKWCERNPISLVEERKPTKSGSLLQAKQELWKPRPCVYCESSDHKSVDCGKVVGVAERKKELASKKLCYNCTGIKHRASECRSKTTCQKCSGKHHTSICDNQQQKFYVATGEGAVIFPMVVVMVDGVKCRALLDTGAGSSYASAPLIKQLGKRPVRTDHKRIDMMMCSTNQRIETYNVKVADIRGKFEMSCQVSKVDKGVLLSIPNPKYDEKISQHKHLEGVVMDDDVSKPELPVHLILGASDYSRIKTNTKPKLGQPGQPIAELTAFGWTMMSAGKEEDLSTIYMTKTSTADYDQLCSLDILGLHDGADQSQELVHQEFQEQLRQTDEGWYETGLLWKSGHNPLPTNKVNSLGRLNSLIKKLQRNPDVFSEYDDIIQDQWKEGIVEEAKEEPVGKEFYIPHKPVIKKEAESTKMRIVYDASAREKETSPSLNECLETGPPLQNLLWSVLVRNRLKPVALSGDLKQAFLQIRIRPVDRDSLRFHWIKNRETLEVVALRFTRALFGLVQSPFLLGGTIKQHLASLREKYPKEVKEIEASLYVDDIITGGETADEVHKLKETTIEIFGEAQFKLHKWHSNIPELERSDEPPDSSRSYAKEQLGVKPGETKLLGLPWNKGKDTISVSFPDKTTTASKREVLRYLASIYDPLGIASPTSLLGKLIYREICDLRLSWDEELPQHILNRWQKFEKSLPEKVEVPRSLTAFQEPIETIDLHTFGDASVEGTAAAVYAVVYQESGINQGLIAAKSRLAKKELTIPRLELVSAHMAANLADNVKNALQGYPVRSVFGWLDSTVALCWIKGQGAYKQFVANRVRKINAKDYIEWRHVGTEHNPADVGSRGCVASKLTETWFPGPDWLPDPDRWPKEVCTKSTKESEVEAKQIKEVFAAAVDTKDVLDEILQKHEFWKAVRIVAWIFRFLCNCKATKSERSHGPLTTAETKAQVDSWVRKTTEKYSGTEQFKEEQLKLNLQKNTEGLYECRGRIQGSYPIFLSPLALLSEKMVHDAHIQTLHGGVGLTMAYIRRNYWIPRLRQLAKKVIRRCFGCRKFQVTAFHNPPVGNLPTDRTVGSIPFQVLGVDYAGPIAYKVTQKRDGKAYIILFACSLTRAIHLELLPDQTTEKFIKSLKRFIARRGRPMKVYSDNGKTFVAAAKWLSKIMKDEVMQNFLAHQSITWQFNLSKAPWWGGQFERMVGLVKRALYKTVGRAKLKWDELEEVILDVEASINNRPLGYIEDDIQLPTLTPNSMMFMQPNLLPEENVSAIEDPDLRKRAKYLSRCKDAMWTRWTEEYLKGLRERHNLNNKGKEVTIKAGDVVLIKNDERNRGKWNIGVVVEPIKGRDGVVRAVRLRAGKSYLERAVQQLYPMELSCDAPLRKSERQSRLCAEAREFQPKRMAARDAAERIKTIADQEGLED